jgi:hypothetical protein
VSTRLSPKLALLAGEPTHWCPGCNRLHRINVNLPNGGGAQWGWDGNVERPTFTPSINIMGQCHYFLRTGRIEFCADSSHALAGQRVELPDLPEWFDNAKPE